MLLGSFQARVTYLVIVQPIYPRSGSRDMCKKMSGMGERISSCLLCMASSGNQLLLVIVEVYGRVCESLADCLIGRAECQ